MAEGQDWLQWGSWVWSRCPAGTWPGGAAVRDAEAYQKTFLLCCLLLTIPQRKSQFECVCFNFYSIFFFFSISILKCP